MGKQASMCNELPTDLYAPANGGQGGKKRRLNNGRCSSQAKNKKVKHDHNHMEAACFLPERKRTEQDSAMWVKEG